MGLWDKVKSVKNMITGGGAEVTCEFENASINGFTIHVKAVISDADLKVDKVYLKLRAEEEVVAPDIDMHREQDGSLVQLQEDVHHSEITFQQEFVIAGGDTLKGGEEYTWSKDIELEGDIWPTYKGVNAQHNWMVFVGLDAPGNDPDTGWVEIELYP